MAGINTAIIVIASFSAGAAIGFLLASAFHAAGKDRADG